MEDYKFRSLDELIHDLQGFEKAKEELNAKCTTEISSAINTLKDSIERNADSSDKLGKKVFWLNVILTAATVVGTIATVVIAFKS